MSTLDLDPENYTLNEISDFFNLNPNHNITQVNDAFRNKHNEVTLSKTLPKPEKDKMCSFFEQLKNKLVLNLTQKPHEDATFNSYSDVMSGTFNNRIDTIIPKNKVLKNNASVLINSENAHQKVINKLLSIDTIFRENYLTTKSTNFKLNIPSTIKNVKSINLVALEVPLTFYNISQSLGNNYLHIDLSKVVIPDGKYTNEQLIAELNSQFGALDPVPVSAYNTITNKTTIDLKNNTTELNFIRDKNSNEFTWNGGNADNKIYHVDDSKGAAKLSNKNTADPINKKLGWLLGYRDKKYVGTTNVVSEGPLNTNALFNYFYFILDDFNHNQDTNIIALKNNSIHSTKILARISNNLMSKKILMEGTDNTGCDCLTHKRVYYGPVDVNKLHIRITDEFGRDLDLNNSDISMGINFECIYD